MCKLKMSLQDDMIESADGLHDNTTHPHGEEMISTDTYICLGDK